MQILLLNVSFGMPLGTFNERGGVTDGYFRGDAFLLSAGLVTCHWSVCFLFHITSVRRKKTPMDLFSD
ncbi:hypothetical protein A343_0647 [Porphyromonas gingivalis JCVI SC001]|nr:hypothetical protein A343_0647 [Porphyromonas gingivalis JCVI SC001]